uniref:Uncharacterized protein n=1 Tax=Ciona savignyi TaxID=51511 RepID=H2Z8U5_CIOSA
MNSIEISSQISDVSLPLPQVRTENHSFQASHFSFNKTMAENTSHVSNSLSFGDLEISDGDLNTSIPPMRNSLTSFCQYQNGSAAHSINMIGSMTPSNSTDKPLNATNGFSPCTEFSTSTSTNQHDSLPTSINTSASIETDSDSGKSANQYGLIRTSITKLKRKFRKH